jgi:plasmid stability protein
MATMIQIRNVPEDLHRLLKARAALAGTSLSEFLLAELRCTAERPTRQEMLARLRERTEVNPQVAPAEAVRTERDRR